MKLTPARQTKIWKLMHENAWLSSQMALLIWDPDLWDWYPNRVVARRKALIYRARGIVEHDRQLCGDHKIQEQL